MKSAPGVWGIDLGQCALKAVRLTLVGNEVVAQVFFDNQGIVTHVDKLDVRPASMGLLDTVRQCLCPK